MGKTCQREPSGPYPGADAVGDILKGLIKQDLSKSPDVVADILAGLKRAASVRAAPSVSGLSGRGFQRMRSTKYFPRLFEVSAPSGAGWLDPLADAFKRLQVRCPSR